MLKEKNDTKLTHCFLHYLNTDKIIQSCQEESYPTNDSSFDIPKEKTFFFCNRRPITDIFDIYRNRSSKRIIYENIRTQIIFFMYS